MAAFRDWLISLSLSNVLLLNAWNELLFTPENYFQKGPRTITDFSAVLLNIFSLSILFWIAGRWIRVLNRPAVSNGAKVIVLLLLLIPLDFLRYKFHLNYSKALELRGNPFVWIACIAVCGAAMKWRHQTLRSGLTALLIFFPFTIFTVPRAAYSLVKTANNPGIGKGSPSTASFHSTGPRVVWLIFDELDQRVAFDERPPGLNLPAFDKFSSESIRAINAVPPATNTLLAMPALLSGREFSSASPSGRDLLLQEVGTTNLVPWSSVPSLVSRASAKGIGTAITGWLHPYDSMISGWNECVWVPYPPLSIKRGPGLFSTMLHQLGGNSPFHLRELHKEAFLRTREACRQFLSNSNYGFVLCHLPVPHFPGIYEPKSKTFTLGSFNIAQGYLDNLVLADKTLSELRQVMEEAGTWDRSFVLVTSDHHWREANKLDGKMDPRVPFLLKCPSQKEAVQYSPEFKTVRIAELSLMLLEGKIKKREEVIAWLNGTQERNSSAN